MMSGPTDQITGWRQKIRQHVSGKAMVPKYLPHAAEVTELNPDWINIETLHLWLQICDNQHGDRCKLSKVAIMHPRWLVDVDRLCLVEAKSGDRYVALSYVWGQVECAKALKSNLERFQQPGSISDANEGVVIPRTIRDAMCLAKLLGEKLLWVDSLCIVQDGVESKHAQLNEMASIYANAYVTIIAANGWDANHGLRGIKGVTETRMLGPNGNQDIAESLQPYSTIWYSRGWTFQELIFSRRKIMFQYQMAIWECSCGGWHEATTRSEMAFQYSSALSREGTYSSMDAQSPPGVVSCTPLEVKPNLDWPDLQQYMNLVRNYNDRQLTFPEDVIAGFSGVLSILSDIFVGGFIYGLPEMFFDVALLWQPTSPLERRVSSSKTAKVHLPSWSWIGWRGDIDKDSWASGSAQMVSNPKDNMGPFQYQIKSTCRWSCGDGTTWRKIAITHYKCLDDRLQYIMKTKELPDGWSMSLYDSGEPFFCHESMPTRKFYYPVAFGANRGQSKNNTGHLLSFRTRRIWLNIGDQVLRTGRLVGIHCSHRRLLSKYDEPCGVIQLNITPTFFRVSKDPWIGLACELIVISSGSTPTSLYTDMEWVRKFGVQEKAEMEEFYNVLWIEWKDGIAYRKALGRVAKYVFNGQPEEWIDVILG
jgi:hypothetical protein